MIARMRGTIDGMSPGIDRMDGRFDGMSPGFDGMARAPRIRRDTETPWGAMQRKLGQSRLIESFRGREQARDEAPEPARVERGLKANRFVRSRHLDRLAAEPIGQPLVQFPGRLIRL